MWGAAFTISLLLASQAVGGVVGDVTSLLRRDAAERQLSRGITARLVEDLERRQAMNTSAVQNFTTPTWNADTEQACPGTLQGMNGNAGNPSGLAACYNINYLDSTTGEFQADLRLFSLSPPSGDFANVNSQNVMLNLQYVGAQVSAVNSSDNTPNKRDLTSMISWPRDALWSRADINQVATYQFVGQINSDLVANTNDTSEQKLLVPTVGLTGMQPGGQMVNTTLSSNQATFVNGVFAKTATPITKAVVSPPIQTLVLQPGNRFVLPGYKILIFPIGGIITGVRALLFMGTIAYGTVGRIQFRDRYRRRVAMMTKGGMARI